MAREQKQIFVFSEQQVNLLFDSEDFAVKELNVYLRTKEENIPLELKDDRSFNFPKENGEFVIVVDLLSDRGSAQYVGNVLIK